MQTYTPDTMTLDINEREFRIEDPSSLWKGKSLYELYGEASTPWRWHARIFERARELGPLPPFSLRRCRRCSR
jgi:N-acetylneuraminate synthase